MSQFSDFFIATPEGLRSLDWDLSPLFSLPSIVAQGVRCSDVFLLQSIVDGSFREQPVTSAPVPAICAAWHYYPSVLQVRADVVEALSKADGEQLAEWAKTWAATSDWRGIDFTPERVAWLVLALARLARHASDGGCGIYLWLYDGPPEEVPVATSQG
jgi:hypothetical protein